MQDDLTKEERLWRVRVVRYTSKKLASKPVPEALYFILAASSGDEAMTRAEACGVTTASFGRVLKSVEAVEAATIELPYQL